MFSTPIDDINYEEVKVFCEQGLPEGQRLEYKGDFPSDLPKEVSAFANTLGGVMLIGVAEDKQTKKPILPVKGITLSKDLSERVTASCLQGIYPPVFPEIQVCRFSEQAGSEPDRAVIVVRVTESGETPHWIGNRDKVYVRVENISQPYRLANYQEMEWLWNRRARSIDLKRTLGNRASERLEHVAGGACSGRARRSAVATPAFPAEPLTSAWQLMELAKISGVRSKRNISFPYVLDNARYVADGVMMVGDSPFECIQLNQCGHFSYVESQGDDEVEKRGISTALVAIWLAMGLRHALNLYRQVGYFGLVDFEFTLEGVRDLTVFNPLDTFTDIRRRFPCLDREISVRQTRTLQEFEGHYSEVFGGMLSELLRPFNHQVTPQLVARLLADYGPLTS